MKPNPETPSPSLPTVTEKDDPVVSIGQEVRYLGTGLGKKEASEHSIHVLQKDALLKHAATLLRASRYALRKMSINAEDEHAGYFDSVHKLIAVIEGHYDAPSVGAVMDSEKVLEEKEAVTRNTAVLQNALEQSFAAEDTDNLSKIAHIPDDKLRGELATANAAIEYCNRLLDEHYGLARDGMKSMDPLEDRIARLLSEQQPMTGWLIERGSAFAPDYLTVRDRQWSWLPEHETALRFSRREDAESVGTVVGAFDRIAEHSWDNSVVDGSKSAYASGIPKSVSAVPDIKEEEWKKLAEEAVSNLLHASTLHAIPNRNRNNVGVIVEAIRRSHTEEPGAELAATVPTQNELPPALPCQHCGKLVRTTAEKGMCFACALRQTQRAASSDREGTEKHLAAPSSHKSVSEKQEGRE